MVIDRNSPVPLYYQLKQQMEKIEKGEWKPGDSVPTEQELQQSYNLSRTTVRQALAEMVMVMEGRLIRQRGRGTYVAQPKFQHDPLRHRGIGQYLLEQGLTPGWKVLDARYIAALAEIAASLHLSRNARVSCTVCSAYAWPAKIQSVIWSRMCPRRLTAARWAKAARPTTSSACRRWAITALSARSKQSQPASRSPSCCASSAARRCCPSSG